MSEMIVSEPLASRIRQEAQSQGIEVEQLLEAALRHYRFKAQRDKLIAEATWWRSQPDDVRQKYAGEFVAIYHQSVIDHDRDEDVLLKRVRAEIGKKVILITPSLGRREMRITSTRSGMI